MMRKSALPLTVTSEQLDEFIHGIRDVVELAETSPKFRTEALAMARAVPQKPDAVAPLGFEFSCERKSIGNLSIERRASGRSTK